MVSAVSGKEGDRDERQATTREGSAAREIQQKKKQSQKEETKGMKVTVRAVRTRSRGAEGRESVEEQDVGRGQGGKLCRWTRRVGEQEQESAGDTRCQTCPSVCPSSSSSSFALFCLFLQPSVPSLSWARSSPQALSSCPRCQQNKLASHTHKSHTVGLYRHDALLGQEQEHQQQEETGGAIFLDQTT